MNLKWRYCRFLPFNSLLISLFLVVTAGCSEIKKPFSRGDQKGGSEASAPSGANPENLPTGSETTPNVPETTQPSGKPEGPHGNPEQNHPGQNEPSQNDPGQNQPGQNGPSQNSPSQNGPVVVPAEVLTIQKLTYDGAGCAAGTVASHLAGDAKAFTLVFNDFSVVNDGQLAEVKKACAIQLSLAAKPGWAFAIISAHTRGYAGIESGALGTVSTWFTLNPNWGYDLTRLMIPGTYDNDYQHDYDVPLKRLQWSGCQGQSLVINLVTELAVSSQDGSPGQLTIDSIDGEISQQYGIVWQRCKP